MDRRYSVIFARRALCDLVTVALDPPHVIVSNKAELATAISTRWPQLAFIELDRLAELEKVPAGLTVIGIVDGGLDAIVRAIGAHPTLSHVISTAMLATPLARPHLEHLRARIAEGPEHPFVSGDSEARVALLTSSARRESRFERVREFFGSHGVSERATTLLVDVAEELVTNALYDAPVEAGYFPSTVPRTEGVELPAEHACEITYGVVGTSALLRIRDPFGALTRRRMMGVLERCNKSGVALDESRGGAGLGLWRVFSTASRLAITVIPGRLTDIVVWVESRPSKAIPKQLLGVDLFFPSAHELDGARSRFAADHDDDLMDDSFTALVR